MTAYQPSELQQMMDRLYSELLATRIICLQMYAYFWKASSKEGERNDWLLQQRKRAHESVDLTVLEGYPEPEKFRQMVKSSIDAQLHSIILGADSKRHVQ